MGRSERPVIAQLCGPAQRAPTGFDHAQHGSNRRPKARRASQYFRAPKLSAGMTIASAIADDRAADAVPALLRVAGLAKRYGEQRALADISFAANAGEVLGLIGPNGAGKTTLMETIAGVLPADGGHILWRGRSVPLHRRRELMFYLPDGLRPWEDQHAASVIEFFAAAYGRPASLAAEAIHTLALAPVPRRQGGAVAKGYCRRLMLALALIAPQPLLLMDEPFDGFDLRQTREIMTVLRDVAGG